MTEAVTRMVAQLDSLSQKERAELAHAGARRQVQLLISAAPQLYRPSAAEAHLCGVTANAQRTVSGYHHGLPWCGTEAFQQHATAELVGCVGECDAGVATQRNQAGRLVDLQCAALGDAAAGR